MEESLEETLVKEIVSVNHVDQREVEDIAESLQVSTEDALFDDAPIDVPPVVEEREAVASESPVEEEAAVEVPEPEVVDHVEERPGTL